LGVNFFDTSPYYGLGRAESILGKGLKGTPRDKFIVATKCGRYGENTFDFSGETVTKEFAKSLERLGLDYVDILHIHDIEFGDLDQIVNETIPALRKLQAQGKCKYIGITGYPIKIFPYVAERTSVDVILSYSHHSLNDNSLSEVIPQLRNKGVGIINAAALSMGLLTQKGSPSHHPASRELKEGCKKAVDYAKSKGIDLASVALQYSIFYQDIATTCVGIASVEELEKNVRWALVDHLDEEFLKEILHILEPVHNITWPSGRPENN